MIVMLRSRSFDLVNRGLDDEDDYKKLPRLKGSYGTDLYALEQDRAIPTEPEETSRRRTIKLERRPQESWGFTLQTYGIRNKKTGEVEVMSYVDYIDMDGPAWMSGMRTGDIILSVNGESVESATHVELVNKIMHSRYDMRLVVLFENCCKKVELHERYLKLKKVLALKLKELRFLEEEERLIRQGVRVTRLDNVRNSTGSSISSDWDIYSAVASPNTLKDTPSNQFAFRQNSNQAVDLDSITLESSSLSEQWQNNASTEEIYSSGPDLRNSKDNSLAVDANDSRELELSGQSDYSEASDSGLRKLYNITRCAQRISDAGRCDGILAYDLEELRRKAEEGSMTNLAEDLGVELREVKSAGGQERLSSSISSSSSSYGKEKLSFYIESDCEDSSLNSESVSQVIHNISSISECNFQTSTSEEEEKSNENDHSADKRNSSSSLPALLQDAISDKGVGSDSVQATLSVKIRSGTLCSALSSSSDSSHNVSTDASDNKDTSYNDKDVYPLTGRRTISMKSDCSTISGTSYSSSSVSDDSSVTSSRSRSSSSNNNDTSNELHKVYKNTALMSNKAMGSADERAIFQQPFYPESTSNAKRVLTSSPIQFHSKHSEYKIQKPGSRIHSSSSLSKRHVRRSQSTGVTPVLLSYKKDAGIHTESKRKNKTTSLNQRETKKDVENHNLTKIETCKYLEEKDNAHSSSVDTNRVNRNNAKDHVRSQELELTVQDGLSSSGKSNSLRSLSNVSDSSSSAERVNVKLVKNNGDKNKIDDNEDDDNKNDSSLSSYLKKDEQSLSAISSSDVIDTNTSAYLSSTTTHSKLTTSQTSKTPVTNSKTTSNNNNNDTSNSPKALYDDTVINTSNDFRKTTLTLVKNIPRVSSAQAARIDSNRSGRFMYGILVNNENHSTRL